MVDPQRDCHFRFLSIVALQSPSTVSQEGELKVSRSQQTGMNGRWFNSLFSDNNIDSFRLVVGCADGSTHVLDGESGKRFMTIAADVPGRNRRPATQRFDAHAGSITSVCFSPDGKMLVTSSSDHTSKAWNATSFMQHFASVSAESSVAQRLGRCHMNGAGEDMNMNGGIGELSTTASQASSASHSKICEPRQYISHADVEEAETADVEAAEYLREVLEENRIQALVVEGMLDNSEREGGKGGEVGRDPSCELWCL